MTALEQNLIQSASVIEGAKSSFEPLDGMIMSSVIEALVVDTTDFNAVPRSPDLVRKLCSSQKPKRFICAAKEAASFQSFVMCSILRMEPRNAYLGLVGFHGS